LEDALKISKEQCRGTTVMIKETGIIICFLYRKKHWNGILCRNHWSTLRC